MSLHKPFIDLILWPYGHSPNPGILFSVLRVLVCHLACSFLFFDFSLRLRYQVSLFDLYPDPLFFLVLIFLNFRGCAFDLDVEKLDC